MAHEVPGVDYLELNTESTYITLSQHFIEGNFKAIVKPPAFGDLKDWLMGIKDNAVEAEQSTGDLVVCLSLADSPVMEVSPTRAEWLIVSYQFIFKENHFLWTPRKMLSADVRPDPLMARFELPEDTPLYDLESADIDWRAGYQLTLEPDTSNHYLFERQQ